jgi:hypothetical protein
VRLEEWFLDVEAILQEDEGCVCIVLGQRGQDEVDDCGRDIRNILGGEEDVIIWWEVFGSDAGDGFADCV